MQTTQMNILFLTSKQKKKDVISSLTRNDKTNINVLPWKHFCIMFYHLLQMVRIFATMFYHRRAKLLANLGLARCVQQQSHQSIRKKICVKYLLHSLVSDKTIT